MFSHEDSHAKAASRRPQSGLTQGAARLQPTTVEILFSLEDSHAKPASRRPQSGLKGTARLQSATTKCVFRLQIPTRKRPRGGVNIAAKALRNPKAQPQTPALVCCFPLPGPCSYFSSKDKEKTHAYKKCNTRHIARSDTPQ